MAELRRCSNCRTEKPETEFFADKRTGKLNAECKACKRERDRMRKREERRGLRRHTLGEELTTRKCMIPTCRQEFKTSQDYRMCESCRNSPAWGGMRRPALSGDNGRQVRTISPK